METIQKYNLPEHINHLYMNEASSSIGLTREVADKINELVDALNKLNKDDLEWKQVQEGTIRKGVIFMKDNLINSINELFKLLYESGELDDIITRATLEELALLQKTTAGITNVKSFGAIGDGIVDDSEALQNAIKYAEEETGYLYIPSGKYRYKGTLKISKSIRILGDKGAIQYEGTYLLHDDSADIPAIHVEYPGDYVYNVFMDNIAVKNNTHDFLTTLSTKKTGILLSNVSESKFTNCAFYGFNIGIHMQGVTITDFEKCWIYYNNYGIWTARTGLDGKSKTQNRFVNFNHMNIYRNGVGVVLGGEQISFKHSHMENQEKAFMLYDNTYSADCKFLDVDTCNIVSQFDGVPFIQIAPSKTGTSKILYTSVKNTQLQLSNVDYAIKQLKSVDGESYIINAQDIICMGVTSAFIGGAAPDSIVLNQSGQMRCVANFDGSGNVLPISQNGVKLLGWYIDATGTTNINGVLKLSERDNVKQHGLGDLWIGNGLMRFNDGKTNTYVHTHQWHQYNEMPESTFEGQMIYDATYNIPRFYNHRTNRFMDGIPRMAAIPTANTWYKGDVIFNSNPVGNGAVGWICVETGTPGKWRKFGTVATE